MSRRSRQLASLMVPPRCAQVRFSIVATLAAVATSRLPAAELCRIDAQAFSPLGPADNPAILNAPKIPAMAARIAMIDAVPSRRNRLAPVVIAFHLRGSSACSKAFSAEVDAGSAKENATSQES